MKVKKSELAAAVDVVKAETQEALQLVFDELNHGQQQKILKVDAVKELFDRYGVKYDV